jgi:hypothetical protein
MTKTMYTCHTCNFSTNRKYDYQKHLQTKKHKKIVNNIEIIYECNICNKKYKYRQGLYKHKQNCNVTNKKIENNNEIIANNNNNEVITNNNNEVITNNNNNEVNNSNLMQMINKYMETSTRIQEMLIEQNSKLIDIAKEPKTSTINITNTSTNTNKNTKNTFNLNNFLHVDCKEAINFKDFVDSITVNRKELEFLQQYGYINSFKNVVINQLLNMEQSKRPLHCLDQKRKQFIVREQDKWTRENIEKHFRYAIEHFCTLHMKEYISWKDENPHWKDDDGDLFMLGATTNTEILSPYNDKKTEKIENKILLEMTNCVINK